MEASWPENPELYAIAKKITLDAGFPYTDPRTGETTQPTQMKCKLIQCVFNRWLVVNAEDETLAWSGSRWVPVGGSVQVCNFDTESQAAGYATSLGFEVVE